MKSFSHVLSSASSDPLFSSLVGLYVLILLYFPHFFLRIVFSPLLNATGVLLFALLRLGAIQRLETRVDENKESGVSKENEESDPVEPGKPDFLEGDDKWVASQSETEAETTTGFEPTPCFEDPKWKWDVSSPLEIIHEEHEGEGTEDPDSNGTVQTSSEWEAAWTRGLQRYPSLSMYYPESDSDTSSDGELGDFPVIEWYSSEGTCFSWNEEDVEGLIEITLDENDKRLLGLHVEEENFIEIDLSPMRKDEFNGEEVRFTD